MTALDRCTLESGELYVFTDETKARRVWGIFEGLDEAGRILLGSETEDFSNYRLHTTLPEEFSHAESATRSDLLDYAYNLGFNRL